MFEDPEKLGLGAFPLGTVALGGYGFGPIFLVTPGNGARFLDVVNEDYATRGGIIRRTTATKQRVVNLLVHRFGSSQSVRGVKMPEVHDANTERFMDREVRTALQPLLTEGAITITRIISKTGVRPGFLGVSVEFIDNETGDSDTAEV